MSIEDNILRIREEIAKTCQKYNRNPEEVKLLAVSKTFPMSAILAAHNAGQLDFAESRVQEFLPKQKQAPELNWHFIGHLQSNKINKIVNMNILLHSVDSLELAEKLSERLLVVNKTMDVLLQVNIDKDPAKFGFTPAGLRQNIEKIIQLKGINVKGLMTIGTVHDNPKAARVTFANLRGLRDALNEVSGCNFNELSMGMSSDYKEAIAEGATIVRVGTAIFGVR